MVEINKKLEETYMKFKNSPIGVIIEKISLAENELSAEKLDYIRNSYDDLQDYMKSLPYKEYSKVDKEIGSEITNLISKFNKQEEIDKTRYEMFIDEANRHGWLPVIDAIEFISKRDKKKGEISEKDIEEIEEKIHKVLEYTKNSLSPYYNTVVKKEFAKKIRELRNRVNRIIKNDVGLYLKQLRKEKGYSYKKLAELADISQSYVFRIENGERSTPSVPILNKILKALDVNPNDFYRKINMEQDVESQGTTENLFQMISLNNYTIDDKIVTVPQKEKLSELLKVMLDVEWSNESKVNDMSKILNSFEEFKYSLK